MQREEWAGASSRLRDFEADFEDTVYSVHHLCNSR